MTSHLTPSLLGACLAASALAATAQPAREPPPGAASRPGMALVLPGPGHPGGALAFAGPSDSGAGERVVSGAPYCAEALHESVQRLFDADGAAGNRIVRQHRTRLCRDGAGRTRQEIERGGRTLVYLRDPVAREAWVLDSARKSARALRGPALGEHGAGSSHPWLDADAWRDYGERMREWGRGVAERARSAATRAAPSTALPPPRPAAPPVPPPGAGAGSDAEAVAIVHEAHRDAEAAGTAGGADLRVLRLQGGAAGFAPTPLGLPMPPGVAWTAEAFAPRGPAVVTSLGSKEVEGLKVHGERSTWTIEAGKLGNERPIVIVREVWTSPELMLTVQSRDFDPRRGETSYRLVNVKRGEPDPALMKVPADHTRSASAPGRG
jgi:hypothetical protein